MPVGLLFAIWEGEGDGGWLQAASFPFVPQMGADTCRNKNIYPARRTLYMFGSPQESLEAAAGCIRVRLLCIRMCWPGLFLVV